MKKLDLTGGEILRNLFEYFAKEKSAEALLSVFACLRDSEVWIPVYTDFEEVDDAFNENDAVKAKNLSVYPFFVEDRDGNRYLTAYSWLNQIKKEHTKDNIIQLSFIDCMSWALSFPSINGIVLDRETKPFTVYKENFQRIAKMPAQAEDEYIYAKVRFKAGGKAFYYETLRTDLTIGDKVIVPFGVHNKEKIGTIVKIEKYDSEHLPYPYFSTKYILRKTDEPRFLQRANLTEKILLQEQESYDIIKNFIERENLFSFDAYYNTIFAAEDGYSRQGEDRNDGEITTEQRERLREACKPSFDVLDKSKPIAASNSVGVHYANELFYDEPNDWLCTGDPFLWAYLSREFSKMQLPLQKERFLELFDKFTSFIPFPERDYSAVPIPLFAYRDSVRAVTRCSVERMSEKLLKNLRNFDERMTELTQRDKFALSDGNLTKYFGKNVKITTLKGAVIRGKETGFSIGNNGFVSFEIRIGKSTREITIDEIGEMTVETEENAPSGGETTERQYCFVGVSPKGYYDCNYWYIDEEKKTVPDTYVWVCMGKNNQEQIVYVDSVQYCTADNAPYDIDKAKRVLRQATEEESEEAALHWER